LQGCVKVFLLVALPVFTGACGQEAGWYPIPAQQSLDLGALDVGVEPGGVGSLVKMSDPDADDYIVRDVDPMPGVWRWAFAHPELRFRMRDTNHSRFTAEIAVPEVTFRVTGPVGITYYIDGRMLGSIRCDHSGKFEIDHAIPLGWMDANRYIHVTFEADRRWVSPDDGKQLSFQILQAGFIK
jgi:hypothetical protein